MESFATLNNWLHLLLGFGAAAAAILALSVRKGGKLHRWSGWVFAAGMTIAAFTAWGFMLARPLPLAMIQATLAIYGLLTAILALNPHWRGARVGEWGAFVLLIGLMAGCIVTAVNLYATGAAPPVGPLVFFAILAVFGVLDWKYLRSDAPSRIDRIRRHALRMALVFSETVRAPLLTFSDELGIPFPAIVFGSFLLIPLVYFGAGGRYVRRSDAMSAATSPEG